MLKLIKSLIAIRFTRLQLHSSTFDLSGLQIC